MPDSLLYYLSEQADADLETIFEYTVQEFSVDQAITYLTELDDLFNALCINPEMGKSRPEIKSGLRSIPKGQHVVFYRILDDHIRIIRVLHGNRDIPNFLNK